MRCKILIIMLLPSASFFLTNPAGRAQNVRPDRVQGEYIIQLRPENNLDAAANVLGIADLKSEVVSRRLHAIKIDFPDDLPPTIAVKAAQALTQHPAVVRVEPNYLYYTGQADRKPKDPGVDRMWFLETIHAFDAWKIQADSPSITIAVIDTGVFKGHEDLDGNIVAGQDFANMDDDPAPDRFLRPIHPFFCSFSPEKYPHLFDGHEFEAHGTHVAGTIGALGGNGKGIIGITRSVKIMPLKFLGGPCGSGSLANALAAIEHAVDAHVNIINNSWGGPYSEFLVQIVEEANREGILFVVAAGNENVNIDVNPVAPASYTVPNVITVAASTPQDSKASFSNYGVQNVEIAAPGVDILSTVPAGRETQPGSGYASFNGTSMATPIVSGAAALIMARYPGITHQEVKALLLQSADRVSALNTVVAEGRRLNLLAALTPPALPREVEAILKTLPEAQRLEVIEEFTPLDRVRMYIRPSFQETATSVNGREVGLGGEDPLPSIGDDAEQGGVGNRRPPSAETGDNRRPPSADKNEQGMAELSVLIQFDPRISGQEAREKFLEAVQRIETDTKGAVKTRVLEPPTVVSKRLNVVWGKMGYMTSLRGKVASTTPDDLLTRLKRMPGVTKVEIDKTYKPY